MNITFFWEVLQKFPIFFFHGIYTVQMGAVRSSEVEISFYRTKRCHILE